MTRATGAGTFSGGQIVTLLLIVLIAGGCSTNSFLGRRFDNFNAHYNTFYNANRTFQEQRDRLEETQPAIDPEVYLNVFALPETQGRSAEFEKVITKSADLLRKHPKSKWVDDALMLIGKSYFYQANYVGAEQKFKEVIALGGARSDEARFWLSRSLVAARSAEAAEEVIQEALASDDFDKKYRPLMWLLEGDLRTERGDWERAIEALKTGIPDTRDGDLAARARYLLGQLYETIGAYEQAVEAYADVQRTKPLYEVSYAARYAEIRTQGLRLDADAALEKLARMIRDDKHFQNLDKLEYLEARILAAGGQPYLARDRYRELLYPPPGARRSSLRGELHYRLAELHRDYLGDFYTAAAHFDTAASVLRGNTNPNLDWTPDAIVGARQTANVFRTYRDVRDRVNRMDSLLYLASLDSAAFDSAITQVRLELAKEAARIQQELERKEARARFAQSRARTGTQTNAPNTSQTASQGYGFLNHRNLQRVQEGFLAFRDRWGDRPRVPGWRREEAVLTALSGDDPSEADNEGAEIITGSGSEIVFLPPVDLSQVPRDSLANARMRDELADARYQLANILFLSMGFADSAAVWYRLVIENDVDEEISTRALYAMAEVQQALGDEEASVQILQRIISENPGTEFARQARAELGMEPVETTPDTLEVARRAYGRAYDRWQAGEYRPAFELMLRAAADYRHTSVAPQALLGAATVYTDWARPDSLDLFGPITLTDSLFSEEEYRLARREVDSLQTDSMHAQIEPGRLPESQTEDTDDEAMTVSETPAEPPRNDDVLRPGGQETPSAEEESPPERRTELVPVRKEGDDQTDLEDVDDLDREPFRRTARLADQDSIEVLPDDEPAAEDADPESPLLTAASDTVTASVADSSTVAVADSAGGREQIAPEWTEIEYYLAEIIPMPVSLHALYRAVEEHFGRTEFADVATRRREALEDYRLTQLRVADSLARRENQESVEMVLRGPEVGADSTVTEVTEVGTSSETSVLDRDSETVVDEQVPEREIHAADSDSTEIDEEPPETSRDTTSVTTNLGSEASAERSEPTSSSP